MAADFVVTSVNQTNQLSTAGRLEDVVEVTFELRDELGSGTVTVPLTEDWPSAAEAAVRAKVAGMIGLLNL